MTPEKPTPDFSSAVKEHDHKIVRYALIIVGNVSFALGVIGIFVPLLPTTPFLLLAAACFAKSSKRFYNRLLTNPVFGRYIQDWLIHKRVPPQTKVFAIVLILITMGSSIVFFIPYLWMKIAGACVGTAAIFLILRQPSR